MSGEINGTTTIISNASGDIVGQLDGTVTYNGNMIDISNKSFGDNVTLLAGDRASKQIVFSGNFVYNDGTQFRAVRKAWADSTIDTYTVTFVSDATTDESVTGEFAVTAMSDAIPMGDKVTTALTFSSSGAFTITEASA